MLVLVRPTVLLALTKEERLFLWVGVLVAVLLFGAFIIAKIDRWRKRQMEDFDESPQQLGTFREMYEAGEISKEEYDRCLRRVAERAGMKPKPVQPATPPLIDPNANPDLPTPPT